MQIRKAICVAMSALAVAVPMSVMAQEHGHDRGGGRFPDRDGGRHMERSEPRFSGDHWRDRDIGRFHDRDAHHWAEGHWYHGDHDGRLGWWWVVGALDAALWYSYAAPVYPYPDPYTPTTTVVVEPAATMVTTPPPPPAAAPAATSVWYFCKSSNTYYPYVASCPEGWKQVPATPPR
jgi:hypothetical protein